MSKALEAITAGSAPGRITLLLYIGWRNIWRNPVRSLLTISALAGGLVMVILYAALLEGMNRQMVRHATELGSGHIQIHRQGYIDDQDLYATLPWRYLRRIESEVSGVHVAPRLYAAALASTREASYGVLIRAIDPQREPLVTTMLRHIRSGTPELGMAAPGSDGLPRERVIVGAQLARNMGIAPGSELIVVTQAADGSIGNALYRVSAVLKPLEPGFDRMGVLISIDSYQRLMALESGFQELAVKVNDPSRVDLLRQQLSALCDRVLDEMPLEQDGGRPVVRTWRELNPSVSDLLELSGTFLLIVGAIVVGLASLGMLNTMLMAVHERTHEFGILLSIGMKPRWLLLMVFFESLLLALVAALSGSLLGSLAAGYFERHGIDFSRTLPEGYDWAGIVFEPVISATLRPMDVLYASLLMVAVTLLAALIPSWRAVRLKPAEIMR